ncbi:MAG: HRDC domain-containing protein, partial [Actinomycetota bacterium]|nr:HRDC domain-containing protein [Actinomycetota bacterium]
VMLDGRRVVLAPPPAHAGALERAGELLRQWRRDRAATEKKPAYTILHDATLEAIASTLPGSLRELGAIKGIGPSKLDRYGDEILAVVEQARHG